jgi:hypothetical protein
MTAQNTSKVYDIASGKGGKGTSTIMVQGFGASLHPTGIEGIGYATRYSATLDSISARVVHLDRCGHTEIKMFKLSALCTQLQAAIAVMREIDAMMKQDDEITMHHKGAIEKFIAKHNAREIENATTHVIETGLDVL